MLSPRNSGLRKTLVLLSAVFVSSAVFALPSYQLQVISSENIESPHLQLNGLNNQRQILATEYQWKMLNTAPAPCEAAFCPNRNQPVMTTRRAQIWQDGARSFYDDGTNGLGLNNNGDALLKGVSLQPLGYQYQLHKNATVYTTPITMMDEYTKGFRADRLLENGKVLGREGNSLYGSGFGSGPYQDMNFNPISIGGAPSFLILPPNIPPPTSSSNWAEWDGNTIADRDMPVVADFGTAIVDSNETNQVLVSGLKNYFYQPSAHDENVAVINPDNSIRYVTTPGDAPVFARPNSGFVNNAEALNDLGDVLFTDGRIVRADGSVDGAAMQERPETVVNGSVIMKAVDLNEQGQILFHQITFKEFIVPPALPFAEGVVLSPQVLVDVPQFTFLTEELTGLFLFDLDIGLIDLEALLGQQFALTPQGLPDWLAADSYLNDAGDIAFRCGNQAEQVCLLTANVDVPEPTSLGLLGLGLAAIFMRRRLHRH